MPAASLLIATAETKALDYLFSFSTNIGTGPDPAGGVLNRWLQALVQEHTHLFAQHRARHSAHPSVSAMTVPIRPSIQPEIIRTVCRGEDKRIGTPVVQLRRIGAS
jgi:hypothetical protein